jgi:sulfite exporter TauE/SafE
MLRILLGAVLGFFAWLIMWVVSEKIISVVWPAFGEHQRAFQEAITNGGEFAYETGALVTHIVLGLLVSAAAGYIAAVVSGESSRAPMFAGILLLAMGVAKAAMSWQYVPIWYHIVFTAILLPLAIVGGRLYSSN